MEETKSIISQCKHPLFIVPYVIAFFAFVQSMIPLYHNPGGRKAVSGKIAVLWRLYPSCAQSDWRMGCQAEDMAMSMDKTWGPVKYGHRR